MKIIEKLIEEKNKQIQFHHQKNDVEGLSKTLSELNVERNNLIEDLNSVNYLLDLISEHSIDELDNLTDELIEHENFSLWIEQIKFEFEKLYSNSSAEINQPNKAFIKSEKIKLISMQKKLENELSYFNSIVSKTKNLLNNLQENYCKDLTKGYNIAAVGEKLLNKFGKDSTITTYTGGRQKIMHFLEKTFSLDKRKSKQLFDLLEKCGVYNYVADLTAVGNVYYADISNNKTIPMVGIWVINA